MTTGSGPQRPRWLIDDTSAITEARVHVAHTARPRFFGELLPRAEVAGGVAIDAPQGQAVVITEWIDEPAGDADWSAIEASLARAIEHHAAVRGE